MRASQSLQLDLIEYFLKNGNTVDELDKLGMNALSYAINSKRKISSDIYLKVIKKLAPTVDLVLREDARAYKQVNKDFFSKYNDMEPIKKYFENLLIAAGKNLPD